MDEGPGGKTEGEQRPKDLSCARAVITATGSPALRWQAATSSHTQRHYKHTLTAYPNILLHQGGKVYLNIKVQEQIWTDWNSFVLKATGLTKTCIIQMVTDREDMGHSGRNISYEYTWSGEVVLKDVILGYRIANFYVVKARQWSLKLKRTILNTVQSPSSMQRPR